MSLAYRADPPNNITSLSNTNITSVFQNLSGNAALEVRSGFFKICVSRSPSANRFAILVSRRDIPYILMQHPVGERSIDVPPKAASDIRQGRCHLTETCSLATQRLFQACTSESAYRSVQPLCSRCSSQTSGLIPKMTLRTWMRSKHTSSTMIRRLVHSLFISCRSEVTNRRASEASASGKVELLVCDTSYASHIRGVVVNRNTG
jgi:hypothetical protein